MGLILEWSVLLGAERQGANPRQVLTALAKEIGETEVGISVVTQQVPRELRRLSRFAEK